MKIFYTSGILTTKKKVPVVQGTTLDISSRSDLMMNVLPCQVIWNFFAVDKQGNILPKDSNFTIKRTTHHVLGGIILAVDGTIRDGSEGGFAGQLVASNYEWLDHNKGISIQSFNTTCENSCWPKKKPITQTTEYVVEKEDFLYALSQYEQDYSMKPQAFFDQNQEIFTLCEDEYENYKDYLHEQIPCDYQHIAYKTVQDEFTSTEYVRTLTRTLRTRNVKQLTLPYKDLDTVYKPATSQSYTSTSVSEIRYSLQVQPAPTTMIRFNLVKGGVETVIAY